MEFNVIMEFQMSVRVMGDAIYTYSLIYKEV